MRQFDRAERWRRLLTRHHLAASAGSIEQVAGDLVGLHSTDPATVVLALRARLEPFAVADLEDALYERRTLLRMLAMRRTMFVAVTVDTGDDEAAPAWALGDDLDDTVLAGPPPISFLPALDPTIMGWKHRTWYLGPHRGPLFDRTGNAGPTVWVGGEAVGAWSQRAGGEVVYRLLEDVSRGDAQRIATKARRLTDWMEGVRVTPRFPTPLDRELASA